MIRRHGQPDAFWGSGTTKEATGVAQASRAAQLGQAVEQLVLYISVDGATTITIQAAHSGVPDADGANPQPPNVSTYQNLYYMGTAQTFVFATAGSAAIIIPDFTPGWIRLISSNNVNCLAGFEVSAAL